tara:strand:+ start:39908 stop:40948 length:1041 start_codon:yes stop_codon:yes gene_type:complete
MKNKLSKKKAKGFSSVKTGKRLTRGQKSVLNKELTSLVNDLKKQGHEKSLDKHIKKLQSVTRGRLTRKKMPEKKLELEKIHEKKIKTLIGPKYNKTLTEIPPQLLDKLLTKTIEKYNIEDTEVKDTLVATIVGEKYSKQFNTIVDIIIEINKHIIKYLREWSRHLGKIISYSIYPSSADEDERQFIDEDFRDVKMQLRDKISDVTRKLLPLLGIRDKIKTEYDKILTMLTSNKTGTATPLNIFINTVTIDWLQEFDKADIHKNNTVYHIDNKIDEIQKILPEYAVTAKVYFGQEVSATLVLTADKNYNKFANSFNKAFENIDKQYNAYKNLHAPQKSKSRKSISTR